MMTFGTRLFTMFKGRHVGTDAFGNRYFMMRSAPKGRRNPRWVTYNGMPEPSKVPPMWHAWLHYTIDELPSEMSTPHHAWEKEHLPNLSGTANAYLPAGHIRRGSERTASTSDYQAWSPDSPS